MEEDAGFGVFVRRRPAYCPFEAGSEQALVNAPVANVWVGDDGLPPGYRVHSNPPGEAGATSEQRQLQVVVWLWRLGAFACRQAFPRAKQTHQKLAFLRAFVVELGERLRDLPGHSVLGGE